MSPSRPLQRLYAFSRAVCGLAAIGVVMMPCTGARAEPSAPIAAAMKTPASVFDVFLFRLYESAKCKPWIGAPEQPDLCVSGVTYEADTDILTVDFAMAPTHDSILDFVKLGVEERKPIVLQQLDRLARLAGAVDEWGMIHSIPALHGHARPDFDEPAFRKALAARTVVTLAISYDGRVYLAKRAIDGQTSYEVVKRQ